MQSGDENMNGISKMDLVSAKRQTRVRYMACVAVSTLAFWFFVSLIPLYNKHWFQKKYFPYPIATAGIQTGLVSAASAIISVLGHCVAVCRNGNNNNNNDGRHSSWVFGPHLLWKLRVCFPVGFLFGVKYAVTNLGLKMVPTPIHLLLQSTDLIWTVLWASLINGERAVGFGMVCLAGCVLGTVILCAEVMENVSETPVLAIVFNLISPVLLGMVIATLRWACVELKRKDNRVGGTVSSVEITALKLAISSSVALTLSHIFEAGWPAAFGDLPPSTQLGVLGSSLPILFYQVNCTYLASLTSAVTVGLVGQLKVIPQWVTALIFAPSQDLVLGKYSMAGSLVTLISTAAYALHRWMLFVECLKEQREQREEEEGARDGAKGVGGAAAADETSGLLGDATSGPLTRSPEYRTIDAIA